jgi:hypothetical protein
MRVESSGEAPGTIVPGPGSHALAREGGALPPEARASAAVITASELPVAGGGRPAAISGQV